eukprot:1160629-Pelagomonas_calceolata.AAC.13
MGRPEDMLSGTSWVLSVFCMQHTCHVCRVSVLQGGNDYEIFSSERTLGHTVANPDDTKQQCKDLFMKQ